MRTYQQHISFVRYFNMNSSVIDCLYLFTENKTKTMHEHWDIRDVKWPPAYRYLSVIQLVCPFNHSTMPWKFRDGSF